MKITSTIQARCYIIKMWISIIYISELKGMQGWDHKTHILVWSLVNGWYYNSTNNWLDPIISLRFFLKKTRHSAAYQPDFIYCPGTHDISSAYEPSNQNKNFYTKTTVVDSFVGRTYERRRKKNVWEVLWADLGPRVL